MADFTAFANTISAQNDDPGTASAWRLNPVPGVILDGAGLTTYVYLTTGGAFGSTTSRASVPAGASIVYTRAS